jgi:pyruvate dehydrogenase E2 component (dihydrolipoamide acetyltransferase)
MTFEFKLPDIGEGVHEGEIVRWLVKEGDTIQEDQPIIEIATDKVTAEIPSPVSGVLKERRGAEGDVIQVGSVLAVLEEQSNGAKKTPSKDSSDDKTAPSAPAAAPMTTKASAEIPAAASSTASTNASQNGPNRPILAAPATRRLAREKGIDLAALVGSGPAGRITPIDLDQAGQDSLQLSGDSPARAVEAAVGQTLPSKGERRLPFTPLRRKIAERLVQSQQTAPHFAYVEEADATQLLALHQSLQVEAEAAELRLSYLPFIIKAVIAGFQKYPILNSRLDELSKEIVLLNDCHIGIAVSTPQGLVVPVIKNADQKNVLTLAREISVLADKARRGKLLLEELQGGTFTISSIGSIGGLFGIPIINYPEAAILGVNKIEKRPVVRCVDGEDRIVIRSMLNLSISCDHRLIDGTDAAYFIKDVIAHLENPGRFLLTNGI